MIKTILSALRLKSSNDDFSTRRRYARRECDQCVSVVHGKTFPVENWSQNGVLLNVDDRLFTVDQDIDLMIKFKLRSNRDIIDIAHTGRVIRKGNNKVAIEFKPISKQIRTVFQKVIDDYASVQFANSQSV